MAMTVEEVMKNMGVSREAAQQFLNAFPQGATAPTTTTTRPTVQQVSQTFGVPEANAQQFLGAFPQGTTGGVPPTQSLPPMGTAAPTTSTGGFGLGGFKTQSSSGGSLTDFANALDQATSLAKQKRNALSLGMMMPSQGTLMASDFNSILGNLNNAGDNRASQLTDRALEAATPKPYTYGTATDNSGNMYQVQYDENGMMIGQQLLSAAVPQQQQGGVTLSPGEAYFDPNTGEVRYTNPTTANQRQTTGTGGTTSSEPSSADIKALKDALNQTKFDTTNPEADGKYADPTLYLQNYESYPDKAEFLRLFPPSQYINPENTWLPDEIMRFVKKPASSTEDEYEGIIEE